MSPSMRRPALRVAVWSGLLVLVATVASSAADAPTPLHAAFAPSGNEWWVETTVTADNPVTRLEARVDGGPWQDLEQRRWGAWAASFHVPAGSTVEFRASDDFGRSALSDTFRWPDATPVVPDGDAGGFQADFAPKPGNEWWVETAVEANAPLQTVAARVDGGAWQALTLRDRGAWAGSFHVPAGSVVEFRATGSDGGQDLSGRYAWPDARLVG